ncbi:LysM peptidoglycan-binding domain-containing protein [Neobacillus sp. NPDC093127]|uniref:LysM peptidoglycan-binding domain-containing protein n=1 Tax=Neobacillus sp. NPDC093127 TaxID=3364296 RepID=UPI0037F36462
MKQLFGFLFAILIIYVIYFDLTVGTLPASFTQQHVDAKVETTVKSKTDLPSFDAKVKPGETVISIVEHKINKPLPVSISHLIDDFRKLNPDQTPEKIKIGSTYHFPDYSK